MRYFGLEEANRLVPLLSGIFDQVRPWVAQAQSLSAQLASQRGEGKRDASTLMLRMRYDELTRKINAELQQLDDMGIEVKSADGLVDFPSQLGGRTVYLCWRFGEPAITHWHALDAGFAGRKPIGDPSAFTPSYLS